MIIVLRKEQELRQFIIIRSRNILEMINDPRISVDNEFGMLFFYQHFLWRLFLFALCQTIF